MDMLPYLFSFLFVFGVVVALFSPFLLSSGEARSEDLSQDPNGLLLIDLEHDFLTGKIDQAEFQQAKKELGE
jgi:hypothetical protein